MPSYRHHELGDIFIGLTVTFPDSLPEEAFQHLEAALPPRPLQPKLPLGAHVEEVFMETPDPHKARRDDAMEEDEEGGGPSGGKLSGMLALRHGCSYDYLQYNVPNNDRLV